MRKVDRSERRVDRSLDVERSSSGGTSGGAVGGGGRRLRQRDDLRGRGRGDGSVASDGPEVRPRRNSAKSGPCYDLGDCERVLAEI